MAQKQAEPIRDARSRQPRRGRTAARSGTRGLPLVLDLDRTLIRSDLLFECLVTALRHNPLVIFSCLIWLMQGRAVLKQRLAAIALPDLEALPVDDAVAAMAAEAAEQGREVVLATAADELAAHRLARRFSFISRVIASNGDVNMKGPTKADALAAAYPDGFVYAGDSAADLPVWRAATEIVVVRAKATVQMRAEALNKPTVVLPREARGFRMIAKALRLKQWAKNALVFAPIPLAGQLLNPAAWSSAALAFLALSLVASATYLVNDLLDLAEDRRHWSKRNRPLASGAMPLEIGLLLTPLLGAAGLVLAALAGKAVLAGVLVYTVLTLAYSLRLKKVPILDVTVLAGLFTLRLFLGVIAINALLSPWLFAFSVALFLSLSVAKRHTELTRIKLHGGGKPPGRGYQPVDEPLLLALGMTSAGGAIILLTLYLMAEAFRAGFYSAPVFLWAAPVVMFLWLMRVWLLSQRGELDDDPVAFALKDRTSLGLGAVLGIAFLAASFGGHLAWMI